MRKAGLSFDRYPGLLTASPEIPDEKWGCGIRENDFSLIWTAKYCYVRRRTVIVFCYARAFFA
jgi:hypothetical protein